MADSERLTGWATRWLRLGRDKQRMGAMGNLQPQQDRIIARSRCAQAKRAGLLRHPLVHRRDVERDLRSLQARIGRG